MPVRKLFATEIYSAPLQRDWQPLNRRLLQECLQLQHDDVGGRRWSKKGYPGGYTSYNSLYRLQQISPTFARLEHRLNRHVAAYARALEMDLDDRKLAMTDCWINIMPRGVVHGLHLHPLSAVSGTYYVRTPRGCAGLKFEDPRLAHFMAAPPRLPDARPEHRTWVTLPAQAGRVVLFESWLRHEVPPNPSATARISISFNYHWS